MVYEIAIIGNPNVGKTSIFNILTGSKQYVANWPGVTVEKKVGNFSYKNEKFKLVDLPGIYSLSSMSEDERVARDFFINENPDCIVVVADSLNLERSMFLALQLLEMNLPVILDLNSIDEVKEKGRKINIEYIEKTLNIPVVATSAKEQTGITDLLENIYKVSKSSVKKTFKINYPERIENFCQKFSEINSNNSKLANYNMKWAALNYLENNSLNNLFDDKLTEKINSIDILPELKDIYLQWKFDFLSKLAENATIASGRDWSFRDLLDHVLTHKFLGLIIYILALYMVFSITFTVAAPFSDLLDMLFSSLGGWLDGKIPIDWLNSLIVDGIIGGVGGVLVFVPQIFVLFFFMGFLEESGYLPRAAFLVDKIVRKFGLSGRSFMSIILGFGCSVPAIMSTKTVSNKKERMALILSIPFASCSARLPVYIVLIAAFFQNYSALVLLSIYLLSILMVLFSSKLIQKFITQTENIPFTIELPRFRMPGLKNLGFYTWNKGKHFLEKAGTIILLSTILIWVLSYFPASNDIEHSYAAAIGKSIAPITSHLGWDWKTNTAMIFGVTAKEVIVSTYSTLLNTNEGNIAAGLSQIMTPLSAFSLLIFILGYVPCFATLGVIKSETGSWKWAVFAFFYTTIIAYILANAVYYIGGLFL
ncbi:MAG TPA: ferrous iron transport protein B [Tepiditoga sp.]|nr:ferrous iron transport protein B [Tepiditoga sp.]